jgi:hypothetical protein
LLIDTTYYTKGPWVMPSTPACKAETSS